MVIYVHFLQKSFGAIDSCIEGGHVTTYESPTQAK